MTSLDDTVAALLTLLGEASADVAATGHTEITELPFVPVGLNAKQAAAWWKTLSAAQQQALLSGGLGALYGIKGLPATVEDTVNRWELAQETELTRAMVAAEGGPSDDYWTHAYAVCQATQRYLDNWQSGQRPGGVPPNTPLLLLGFSSLANGGKGSTVLSIGNPDTATHVSGFIEGVTSAPSNLPLDSAASILGAEDHQYGDASHNAIVIYQAGPEPATVFEGVNQGYASTYAPQYAADINAIIDSHNAVSGTPATYTIFAHSYGTEVLTDAARNHALSRVNNDVLLASPGVAATSANAYGINPHHVYAATAQGDPISYAAGDPGISVTSDVGWLVDHSAVELHNPVGFAHVFFVEPGGHSSYFENPYDLGQLARIAEGQVPH